MATIPITPLSVTKIYRTTDNTVSFVADRAVNWSASGGATVQPGFGTSTTVFIPNKTQTIVVSAVSGADSGSASVFTYGIWPVFPHFGGEVSLDDKVLASYAEDGSAVFRRKGGPKFSWTLGFNNTPASDLRLIRDFWNYHRKDIPFYYEDLEFPENVGGVETTTLRLVTCDTGLKVVEEGPDRFTVSVTFRQV
jgi:hypothetical protein